MDFNLTLFSTRQFLYFVLVVFLSFSAYFSVINPQSYWIVISALLFSLIHCGASFSYRIISIFLAGLIAAVLVLIAGVLSEFYILLALFLAMLTTTNLLLVDRYPYCFFIFFSINLLAIVAGIDTPLLTENINRVHFVFVGTFCALLPQIIFWPNFKLDQTKKMLVCTINNLRLVNQEIYACLLQPDYNQLVYLYERRLHMQKNNYLYSIMQLRQFIGKKKNKVKELADRLDELYDISLAAGLLRFRVTDYTIFGVCAQELSAIAKEIDDVFKEVSRKILRKKIVISTEPLLEKIKRLEENYQNVLQITAPEPLVFLLFINSLKAFEKELDLVSQEIP